MQQQGSRNRSKAHPVLREMPLDQLQRVLADHRAWLDSGWAKRQKSRPFACAAAGRLAVERRSSRGGSQSCQSARRGSGSRSLAWRQSAACEHGSCLAVAGQPARCRSRLRRPPKSQAGPRRSFGCQSAQRRSHRSLTLGSTVVGSSARACNRDYRRAVEERASRLNFDGSSANGYAQNGRLLMRRHSL